MYSEYWNLDREPFENMLDPAFFYPSQTHRAALLKLRYLLENGKGAGALVGPTGSGKTFVVNCLANELGPDFGPWVHLLFPQMSADDLLNFLALELGGESSVNRLSTLAGQADGQEYTSSFRSRGAALRVIEKALVEHTQHGRHPVIVIDDAHLIDNSETLQALELLLNFHRAPQCVFSLILLGDRLLLPRLSRLPRFDERLAVRSMLQPLVPEEVAQYIQFRLEVSGARELMFDADALEGIAQLSGGTPRRINRLADLSLLVGYADSRTSVSADDVFAASEELTAVGVE